MIVYLHRRNDTGEPFYIGATVNNKRPYIKTGRNKMWNEITTLTGYTVEIIETNLSLKKCAEREAFYVAKYKTIPEGGTLTNGKTGIDKALLQFKGHPSEGKKRLSVRLSQQQVEKAYKKMLSTEHRQLKPYLESLIINALK